MQQANEGTLSLETIDAMVTFVGTLPSLQRASLYSDWGEMLSSRYERTGCLDDLTKSIELNEIAVDLTPEDNPQRSSFLHRLCNALQNRFEETKSMEDINRAIEGRTEIINRTHDDDPSRTTYLIGLSSCLGLRNTGPMKDLEQAMTLAAEALSFSRLDHPLHGTIIANLASTLTTKFEETDKLEDINRAIKLHEEALQVLQPPQKNRVICLHNYSAALMHRYQRNPCLDDLNASVAACESALDLITPAGSPIRVQLMLQLAKMLQIRFERNIADDVDRALTIWRLTFEYLPEGHPDLDAVLPRRLDYNEPFEDLTKVVEEATRLLPTSHPKRAEYLSRISEALVTRVHRNGSIEDVNRSIALREEVLRLTAYNDVTRPFRILDLSDALRLRFSRTGTSEDLAYRIDLGEETLRLIPSDHETRPTFLNSLATSYGNQASRLQTRVALEPLNRSIELLQESVQFVSDNNPALRKLADGLRCRFECTGDIRDLDKSIELATKALKAASLDNSTELLVLGCALRKRFDKKGSIEDLHQAIEKYETAIGDTQQEGPAGADNLKLLGDALGTRFRKTRFREDFEKALRAYEQIVFMTSAPPTDRVTAATDAARLLISDKKTRKASRFLRIAVEILPTASPRYLNRQDQQKALTTFPTGLASSTAALSVESGESAYEAVRQLELGRGIMASHIVDTRCDISDLADKFPEIGKRFMQLRDDIESADVGRTLLFASNKDRSELAARLHIVMDEFYQTLEEIRDLDGFENFLLGPTENELLYLARFGPIVILNVSYRSHAFLITKHNISLLSLPPLSVIRQHVEIFHSAIKEVTRRVNKKKQKRQARQKLVEEQEGIIFNVLEWLWDSIVDPVLCKLGYTEKFSKGSTWPRVWWCPTGIASFLPLHAAGYHNESRERGRTVMDRVVSSYTSTLRTLKYSRERSSLSSDYRALITTATASKFEILPMAEHEAYRVKDILRKSRFVVDILDNAQTGDLCEKIPYQTIVHCICHAVSEPDPSSSGLLLKEGNLTVAKISQLKIKAGALAYLSACSTSVGQVGVLEDECITISNAFQIAGFAGVVGSLWKADDGTSFDLAGAFYERLQNDTANAANALHQSVLDLRETHPHEPSRWASYLYTGA